MLSLRAAGEGHISSITFQSGMVDADDKVTVDNPTRFVTTPDVVPDALYGKSLFRRKLVELGLGNKFSELVLSPLKSVFTLDPLKASLQITQRENGAQPHEWSPMIDGIIAPATSNYEIPWLPEQGLSKRGPVRFFVSHRQGTLFAA